MEDKACLMVFSIDWGILLTGAADTFCVIDEVFKSVH